eukprot:gnl/TRDRNA2_/TRDRNA2_27735_c0_seq1.p2 gnl/TRDRNA2_/TRDRNA2_27735_c0~~gnl/TRDRNA2_/TRDRNA2_27735_c0_seq1.p2  ORF type:complete len:153 (-),score=32.59 gnl/TRDRNA2_/TRDRNA2_27735_c0_seq1:13-417(-)
MGEEVEVDMQDVASAEVEPLLFRRLSAANDPAVKPVKSVECHNKQQLLMSLELHRFEAIEIRMENSLLLFADLSGSTREDMLVMALSTWFARALQLRTVEVQCHEHLPGGDKESTGSLVLFRLQLDVKHEEELK